MGIPVLVVDDEPDIAGILADRLQTMGLDVQVAHDGEEALLAIQQNPPGLVFLDIQMPKLNGIEVLKRVHKEWQDLPVIIMTAYGTIARAVEAMKEGATDFVTKPFDIDHIKIVIDRALEQRGLKHEVAVLRAEVESRYDPIIASSPKMAEVAQIAKKVAQSDTTVLLLGESGTGKDLLARSMHSWSNRGGKLFAPVNCVALSEELLESDQFGHEKVAFTGASVQKRGKMELANGATGF